MAKLTETQIELLKTMIDAKKTLRPHPGRPAGTGTCPLKSAEPTWGAREEIVWLERLRVTKPAAFARQAETILTGKRKYESPAMLLAVQAAIRRMGAEVERG